MKAYKHALLTGVCMLWFCFRVMPQLCPSNALAPVFSQDFGQGATPTSTSAAAAGTTNYVFGSPGTDGNYSITPLFQNAGKSDWTKLGDHTGNTNGNMFLVNAGGGKSIFFKQTVTGLCSGSTFNFSAWLANANTSSTLSVCGGGYVYPKVIFNIRDTAGNLLSTVTTANLPLSPVNGPANWQQYGMQFSLPNGVTSLVLEMVDYYGGAAACGNDLALDDILFTACTPQTTISLNTSSTICSGTTTTFSTSLVNSPFTTPVYQWQKSTDNGVTWTNIGAASSSANNFILSSVTAGDGALYRVVVGPNAASISSNSCITASNSISLTVNTTPTASINSNTPVCVGSTLSLSTTASGGSTPYSYTWSGPNSFSSTLATPSISGAPSAAGGTYSLTLTDAKGCAVSATSTVTINPVATINAMTATACSGVSFGLTPTNGTNGTVPGGTTYSWSAPTGVGFSGGLSGSGNITGKLTNTTNAAVTATYLISPLSGSCTGASFTATITINAANLVNAITATTCSGSSFSISPANGTNGIVLPGNLYSWGAPVVTGGLAGGLSSTNAAIISGTLTNPTNTVQTATYTVTPQSGVCSNPVFTVTVTVNPVAVITTITKTSCTGVAFGITPTNGVNGTIPAGTLYSWSAPTVTGGLTGGVSGTSATTIGGTLTNPTNTVQTATYTITPVSGTCTGNSFTLTVTVSPIAAISAMTGVSCSGVSFGITPVNGINGLVPAGTLYNWAAPAVTGGLTGGVSGTNTSTINGIFTNSTSSTQTATYTITPVSGGCTGAAFTATISVSPVASVSAMSIVNCSGTSFSISPVDGTNGVIPSGTLYGWSVPVVTGGLTGGASATNATTINGSLINPTNSTQTATYSVTPVSGSCTGNLFSVTVSLNPLATITAMSAVICSGQAFGVTPVNGTNGIVPAGTLYSWTIPAVTGGLSGGASATNASNLSGSLTNSTNAAQTATYTVTTLSGSCTGSIFTLTITVNPVAQISGMSAVICSGTSYSVTPVNVTNGIVPAGTLYSWAAPTVTGGLTGGMSATNAATISGALSNPSNATQTATYIVTPSAGSCIGVGFSVTVTVNPVAAVTALSTTICTGTSFSLTPVNGINGIIPAGTLYSWTAPSFTGGLTGGISSSNAAAITGTLTNPTNTVQTATYNITPVAGSCTGSNFTLTVTVNPVAAINDLSAVICSGNSFGFTPVNGTNGVVPAGTLYSWVAPTVTGGLAGGISAANATSVSGVLNNTTHTAQTATYIVTPISGSCTGSSFTITVTINPVATITNLSAVICSGTSFSVAPVNVTNGIIPAGTLYSWAAPTVTGGLTGGMSTTNAAIISGTLTNPSNAIQTATYIITPSAGSCIGAGFSVTVTVNPVAAVTALSTSICTGTSFSLTPVNGVNGIIPAGTLYSWTSPAVTGGITGGISASNATSIAGSLTNPTNVAQTATYSITPVAGSCTGNTFSLTVTVNPIASISSLSAVICSGNTFALTPINGTNGIVPAGTLYSWAAPTVTGGLTGGISTANAASVSGTLNNPTNTTQTATYIVTPISGSCTGSSFTVIVTVNPVATINPLTAVICSGNAFGFTPVNGTNGIVPAGTLYSWAAPTVTGGLTGGISASNTNTITGSLINPANTTQTATYTITPSVGICISTPFTVSVSVAPTVVITAMTATICSGSSFALTPANGTNGIIPAGTLYNWTVPTVSGGLTGGMNALSATSISGALTNPTNAVQTAAYIVTPVAGNCTGSNFTLTVTVNPVAAINNLSAVICSGAAFGFTPANGTNGIVPAGTLYSWAAPAVTGALTGGLSATNAATISGTLTNPSNTTQTATYTITPSAGTCNGNPFTVSVSAAPTAAITSITTTICSGSSFAINPADGINGIVPSGTLYSWAVPTVTGGLTGGASASNATAITGTLTNSTNAAQTAIYNITPVAGSCTGNTFSLTVTITPIAAINSLSAIICSGASFSLTPINGTNGIVPAGTSYSWAAPTVTGGLTGGLSAVNAASVSGSLINTTNTVQTATYIITPVAGICAGSSFTVTVTVNPVATISSLSTVICSGNTFGFTPLNGTNGIVPVGTLYSWAVPTVTGGLVGGISASNTTSIAGSLINPTNATQTAIYTVTPAAGSCTGNTFSLTVIVNPVASISSLSTVICSGTSFALTPVDGTNGIVPAGTSYSWAAPTVTGGLTGGLSAANATTITGSLINPTNATQTAVYNVTPVAGGCTGNSFSLTVTVNPIASINSLSTVICSGASFALTPINGTNGIIPAGTLYSWAAPSITGGLTGGISAINAVSVSGTLTNPANTAQTATYIVTPVSGICAGSSFTVTVTINPVAIINSLSAVICSGTSFSVTPVNVTNGIVPAGILYSWAAPTVTGGLTGGMSTANAATISGTLSNPSNATQTATYIVTPSAGSCIGVGFSVTVTVNPVAAVTSLSTTICTGTSFSLTPVNGINGIIPAGTLYSWAAPSVTGGLTGGISSSNAAAIAGTLTNPTNTVQTATYNITPVVSSCTGSNFTLTVTVNPVAAINDLSAVICSGNSFGFTPVNGTNGIVPAGTLYSWVAPTVTGGLTGGISAANATSVSGVLNNTTHTAQTATYIVTPLSGSCTGSSFTITVTINPVATITNLSAVICSGTSFGVTPVNLTNGIVPAGTLYSWATPTVTGGLSGGANTANATSISGTLTNPTNAAQTAIYTITPIAGSCTGNTFSLTVTVNPVASISSLSAVICSGTSYALTPVNGTNGIVPAGTLYNWAIPTVSGGLTVGISASNAAGISGSLTNPTNTVQTAIYIVTPISGICTGSSFTVTVTVNPIATINPLTAVICSGNAFGLTPVNGTNGIVPAGTLYSWAAPSVTGGLIGGTSANNATTISGTFTNPTNASQSASYIVTPITGICAGTGFSVIVTVNPVAAVTVLSITTCTGTSFSLTPVNGVNGIIPTATLYSWAVPAVTGGITGGISASNTTSITGSLINSTNAPQTASYIVTPVSGNCTGNTFSLTVTVNPIAVINLLSTAICSGTSFALTPVNGTNGIVPAGTVYSWAAPSVTGGVSGGVAGNNRTSIAGSLANSTTASQTATYSITTVSGNCTGAPFTVIVSVQPLAKAELSIAKPIGCSPFTIDSTIVKAIQYPTANNQYSWYINNVFSGTGNNFPGFILTTDSATVQLKVSSLFGCGTDSVQSILKIYATPRPSFTLSDTTGCAPLLLTIQNTTPSLANFQYKWDLGNGQLSNASQPGAVNYAGAVSGSDTTYTITLHSYQYCDTIRVSKQITVSRKARINFTASLLNNCSPLNVLFTNQSSGKQVQYHLNYGDGVDSVTGTNIQYAHTYHSGNQVSFPATLYATNSCGIDSLVIPIAISPNPVTVNINLSDTLVCGNPFTLSVSNQTTAAAGFQWNFGDGSAVQSTTSTGIINHTYTAAGTYQLATTISGACSDSIVYRSLKIYPGIKAVADSITQNTCIGVPVGFNSLSDSSLSAQWSFGDGAIASTGNAKHSFTQAGTYTSTLKVWKSYTGITCYDSIAKTVAIVSKKTGRMSISDTAGKCLPFNVAVTNQEKPAAETKWSWGDGARTKGDTSSHAFTANGTYRIRMSAMQAGGCMYMDSAIVTISAPSAVSLQYKGGSYCQQNTSIDFVPVTNNTDSIRWNFGDGTIQTTASQKVSHIYSNSGTYLPTFSLLSGGNCMIPVSGKDTIKIDEIKPGFKLNAVNECSQTNYQFTDTSQSFFTITRRSWTLGQQTASSNVTTDTKVLRQVYTKAGNYETGLQVQNSIGCNATLSAKFNVLVYEYPQANINAISQACQNNLTELQSIINSQDSLAIRYWNLGNGTTATDSVVKVMYTAAGNYTVKLTVATVNSCYDSAYKQISINPPPTLVLAPNKTVCKGDSLLLSATGAINYIWSDQDNNIICNNCSSVKVLPKQSTQYKVIGYNEYGCSNIVTTSVKTIAPFKMLLNPVDSMCLGDTRKISVNGASSYTWQAAPGLMGTTGSTVYANPTVTTTYKVVGKDNYNCFTDSASIKLVVGRPTPISIGGDTTVPSGTPIQLNTGTLSPDIRSWKWGGNADYSCVYCASPVAKVIMDEALYCTTTNQFGCITTDTLKVKTFCSGSEVFIPNAFTPDGDGVNDVLIVQGRGIKLIKSFKIFSRWGEMIFEKTNFQPGDRSSGWDGKIKGKTVNSDVFVYLCDAVCERGNSFVFKGNVAVIK